MQYHHPGRGKNTIQEFSPIGAASTSTGAESAAAPQNIPQAASSPQLQIPQAASATTDPLMQHPSMPGLASSEQLMHFRLRMAELDANTAQQAAILQFPPPQGPRPT
jgi:hypothetical protein